MIMKPTKTYGADKTAIIYKKFIESQKIYEYTITNTTLNVVVMVDSVLYGVFKIENGEMTQYSYVDAVSLINDTDATLYYLTAKNQVVLYKDNTTTKFFRLKKLITGDTISENSATFEESTDTYKGTLLSEFKNLLTSIETYKYYKFNSFNYMQEGDIKIGNSQIIKGHITKSKYMDIRWDNDNVDLEEDDLLVIGNEVWQVGEITIRERHSLVDYRSYYTTLTLLV